jgi:hypothetical protein
MTTAFIRTNSELTELLDSWLVKYSADQPRDPHGRWTAGGGGEQVHDPVRVRRAAINTAVHAVTSAAALANALASAGGLRQAPSLLEAVAHAGTLAENLRELRDRSRETYAHGRELAVALRPQMRQLHDHLANAKDHLARIQAERRGDHERAAIIRRRIRLRERAMALRMSGIKRPSRSKVMRDRWAGEYARARDSVGRHAA